MHEQRFKVTRLEAISDGVFAIAMTLLVLNLQLPEMEPLATKENFVPALQGQLPHFISWVISFSILCRLWITQHALLKDGAEESSLFTWFNFGFLGGVSLIPFPTSLISEHGDQPLSVVIFSAVVVFCGVMLGLMCFVRGQSNKQAIKWKELNPAAKRILIGLPLIGILACALAYWKPIAGAAFWIVMPFIGISIKLRKGREG